MIRRVFSLVFVLVNLIKRCFCCLTRRKDHYQDLPISVKDDYSYSKESNWEDWDGPSCVVSDGGSPRLSPVEQQIHQYRLAQQKKLLESQQPPQEDQQEQNLFQDLAPSLPKKPQVVIYARPEDDSLVSNRQGTGLSCTDALMQVGGELGDWSEEEHLWNEGGEEIAPDEIDEVLHLQRQQQRKQQKLKREAKKQKENKNNKIATKIS